MTKGINQVAKIIQMQARRKAGDVTNVAANQYMVHVYQRRYINEIIKCIKENVRQPPKSWKVADIVIEGYVGIMSGMIIDTSSHTRWVRRW